MHHCKDEEKPMAMGVYIPDEVLLIFGSNYFNASLWLRGISYVQYVDRRVLKGDGKMKVVNIYIVFSIGLHYRIYEYTTFIIIYIGIYDIPILIPKP